MNERCEIDAEQIDETLMAYQIDIGTAEPIWIPKSVCDDNGDGTFTVEIWYAKAHGLV